MFVMTTGDRTKDIVGAELTDTVKAVTEAAIYADLIQLPADELKEFCESAEAEALMEKAVLNKKTLVRLSKKDDLARRIKQAAYQLAREKKDTLWVKLVKTQMMKRKLVGAIMKKYQNPALRAARASQVEYIKAAKNSKYIGKGVDKK